MTIRSTDSARRAALAALLLGAAGICGAGGVTDGRYTNFGNDLLVPIIPGKNWLPMYANKGDLKPFKELSDAVVLDVGQGDWEACISQAEPQGRVRCHVRGADTWVDRWSFVGPREMLPFEPWPFRYWLYAASDASGSAETSELYKAVARSPYLVKPKQFGSVFFIVKFDRRGFAISPKTGKRTGDRVFMAGGAAYLAPDHPGKRLRQPWLFLSYYHDSLKALCPGAARESCASAVNLQPQWRGIKALHSAPPKPFAGPMFGAGRTAFARHGEPPQPFRYTVPDDVPDDVPMAAGEPAPGAPAHRAAPFCLIDCPAGARAIIPDPAPQ
ncbi:hypothetical protein HF313_21715 [Massilia atriviolacea]|uniref:Uncharacterized protein n=1 Tax=Massilia atriviolacea TaxID=2495579 RepID=A0A430HFA8_9BURK|nr:hypothetical protein [Massilia atriviolacea]RSZ56193.1 hypothetical protein EJB06_25150 [Massilia atriviolacea]